MSNVMTQKSGAAGPEFSRVRARRPRHPAKAFRQRIRMTRKETECLTAPRRLPPRPNQAGCNIGLAPVFFAGRGILKGAIKCRLCPRLLAPTAFRQFVANICDSATQDLNGESLRLVDDVRDRQFLRTGSALVSDATCVEKICGRRYLDSKIHILRYIVDGPRYTERIQLADNNTNQEPACVKNRAAAVPGLHRS